MNTTIDDPVWQGVRREVNEDVRVEPLMASFLHATILNHSSLEAALSFHLANKLQSPTLLAISLMELMMTAMEDDPSIGAAVRADISAVRDRDPACDRHSTPLLYFKGFHALQSQRISHWLWQHDRQALAMLLQNRVSEVFAVDIHPAAKIGSGILMDHATGIVIGETAVIGNNVSILHGVTLGGTGKEVGDRHPKIGNGVLLSAGATVVGNVKVGDGAKVGACSVVLTDVPPHCTAVGIPAKIRCKCKNEAPALYMDHLFGPDTPSLESEL